MPGVSSDLGDEVGFGLTNTISISINGGRRNAVNWLVDGVSNVDVGSNITLLSTPTLESIQEFKIITSSYAAEWPRSGGGVINIVTKGGTQKFSGTAYEFYRDEKLNANCVPPQPEHRTRRRAAGRRQARLQQLRLHHRRTAAAQPREGVLLLLAGVPQDHAGSRRHGDGRRTPPG